MTTNNAYSAPYCLGDQALVSWSDCGRFAVYKTEGRERGARGAAPFSLYSVHDGSTGKITKLRNLSEIDSLIHFRLTGEQTLPWFAGAKAKAPKARLVRVRLPSDDVFMAALGPCGK